MKAGLKEYGEQAEAGGAAENCESAGALTAKRVRSRDSGAETRILKSFKFRAREKDRTLSAQETGPATRIHTDFALCYAMLYNVAQRK